MMKDYEKQQTELLIPAGFIHCVQELRKGNVPALYDMTLGYPKTLPGRGEMDLITGTMPEEVTIFIIFVFFCALQ